MLNLQVAANCAVPREQEQVIAFVRGEPQTARDGREHAL